MPVQNCLEFTWGGEATVKETRHGLGAQAAQNVEQCLSTSTHLSWLWRQWDGYLRLLLPRLPADGPFLPPVTLARIFYRRNRKQQDRKCHAGTQHVSTPLLQYVYVVCAPWPSPGQQGLLSQGLLRGRRSVDTAQGHTLGLSLLFLHCQELSQRWENARNADSPRTGVTSRITFIQAEKVNSSD